MATPNVTEVLAAAMELKSADDRATVARWLNRCVRAGLWLEAESVRKASESELRAMLDGVPV